MRHYTVTKASINYCSNGIKQLPWQEVAHHSTDNFFACFTRKLGLHPRVTRAFALTDVWNNSCMLHLRKRFNTLIQGM